MKTARSLGKHPDYIRRLAMYGQWPTRVEAWNQHLDAVYQATFIEQAQQAADEDAALLRAGMATVGESIMAFKNSGMPLPPEQAIKWLDVILKYRRQLYGDPTTAADRAHQAQEQQTPVQVDVRHFADLPDEGKLNALRDIMKDNERWLVAATDQDDD